MPKAYVPNDNWSRKAASEGYRARSVYKLMELDARHGLLKPGQVILDLGAAPGSWLQYAAEKIGPKGLSIGFDLAPIAHVGKNVHTYAQDITDIAAVDAILAKHGVKEADLVLSDIAPNTSGIKDVDQWRSVELASAVTDIASQYLKPAGTCVVKVFRGASFDEFLRDLKLTWRDVRIARVEASRDRSREVYMILRGPMRKT